ncbi:hypothetical protein AAFF_G00106070 [Aldrovandia affinis]|uniref:Uncharacterized protein n=1 Tax=Aldrovandia affinis TaxID=143900 RepID=A0AAD7WXU9_9TELE|nr:hypothetical protein AAFF_G00106070 [Aldrovandia affinis]
MTNRQSHSAPLWLRVLKIAGGTGARAYREDRGGSLRVTGLWHPLRARPPWPWSGERNPAMRGHPPCFPRQQNVNSGHLAASTTKRFEGVSFLRGVKGLLDFPCFLFPPQLLAALRTASTCASLLGSA